MLCCTLRSDGSLPDAVIGMSGYRRTGGAAIHTLCSVRFGVSAGCRESDALCSPAKRGTVNRRKSTHTGEIPTLRVRIRRVCDGMSAFPVRALHVVLCQSYNTSAVT